MGSLTGRIVKRMKLVYEVAIVIILLILEIFKEIYYLFAKKKMKDVRGKIALVTGAAQGLGREIALELARKGCTVICVDILTNENEKTAEEVKKIGQKSFAYTCDITDRDKVMKLASQVGNVDMLVNNAGIIYFDPLLMTPPSVITKVLDVNVASHFWMIEAFLPRMLERKEGHIVAIASCAGLEVLPDAAVYSTSKCAVVGFMRTLELELRLKSQQYIKTTCVCPYFINTINDVKYRIDARLPSLEPRDAAIEIVKAIQMEASEVTVPSYFSAMFAFNSILPRKIQHMMRDVFYAYVRPREIMDEKTEKSKVL